MSFPFLFAFLLITRALHSNLVILLSSRLPRQINQIIEQRCRLPHLLPIPTRLTVVMTLIVSPAIASTGDRCWVPQFSVANCGTAVGPPNPIYSVHSSISNVALRNSNNKVGSYLIKLVPQIPQQTASTARPAPSQKFPNTFPP